MPAPGHRGRRAGAPMDGASSSRAVDGTGAGMAAGGRLVAVERAGPGLPAVPAAAGMDEI